MSPTRRALTRHVRMVRLALLTKLFARPFWKLSKTRDKSLVVVPTAAASMSSWNVCAAWSLRCSASTWPYATFNSGCVASGREDAECVFVVRTMLQEWKVTARHPRIGFTYLFGYLWFRST
ncbi:hypothetical protein C8R45DRAFT_1030101, partial [Mycena sanguinolenta]